MCLILLHTINFNFCKKDIRYKSIDITIQRDCGYSAFAVVYQFQTLFYISNPFRASDLNNRQSETGHTGPFHEY